MASSFRWGPNSPLFKSMDAVAARAQAYLSRATQYHALRAEAYMKSHAPWTDRTGNARSGLAAFANLDGAASLEYEIILYGQVAYQPWLEIRNPTNGAGRYAIIVPTIREESPAYFATAQKIMDTLFGGKSL